MATQWDVAESARTEAPTNGGSAGMTNGHGLARSLGWFSIGLGLAEVLAPRQIAKITGTRNHATWIRAFGLREIVSGVGILTNPQPAPWVWARVGGDMLDMAALGAAMAAPGTKRGKTAVSVAAVAGVAALDILCAQQTSASKNAASEANQLEASVVVSKSPEECYQMWHNFEQLPRFMSYLESVRDLGDGRSHWVAAGPGNMRVEWEAETVNDIPGQMISWRSLARSEVCTSGTVEFQRAPGNRGTVVKVRMSVSGLAAMSPLARLMGKHPEQMVYKDLRRFKQIMETGEVITTEGQSAGRSSGATWLDSLAR
jgi:uncharacterized membrane protein